MTGISAVIITKNEEANIQACLQSLDQVAEEIIIFDSFSSDRTKEICLKTQGVRFFEHPFDSFSQQKNRANKMAQNPFILSLDADEHLSESLRLEVLKIKANPRHDAYQFSRLNHLDKKAIRHGLWYPDWKIRLFKKGKAKWVGQGVHEWLQLEQDASMLRLQKDILHYPFANLQQFNSKIDAYSSLWASERYSVGKKSNILSPYLHAVWTAFRGLFLKLAFLDGLLGLQILTICTKESYLKYKKLTRLQNHG